MNKITAVLSSIHIHPLLWVVIAISVMTAHFYELCLFLFIIFIHELGHAFAASWFSWRIKRISLLPFGGVAEMDEHGNRPLKEELIVTLAGPAQHIWMMLFAYILYDYGLISSFFYDHFMQFNFMVFIFNLLPVWPLDGGKLVFLYFSLKQAFPIAHRNTLIVSSLCIAVFLGVVIVTMPLNINAWVIIFFLLFSIYYEWRQSRYIFIRFLLERHYGKNSEFRKLKPIFVQEEELLLEVLERFHRGCKHPIILKKGGEEHRVLDENELLHAYFTEKLVTAKIGDLLYPI